MSNDIVDIILKKLHDDETKLCSSQEAYEKTKRAIRTHVKEEINKSIEKMLFECTVYKSYSSISVKNPTKVIIFNMLEEIRYKVYIHSESGIHHIKVSWKSSE